MSEMFAAAIAVAEAMHAASPPRKRRRKPAAPRVTFYEFLDAVRAEPSLKETRFPGGFHVESRYDYRGAVEGDPVRLTYTYATRVLAATRRSATGQTEKPKRVSLAAGTAFVAELARAVRDDGRNTAEPADSCYCHAVPMPPCSFCENAEWCDDCNEAIEPDLWDDHLWKHEQGLIGND